MSAIHDLILLLIGSNPQLDEYNTVHTGIVALLLEAARQAAARNVNALMTASYWKIGRRIVEFEQDGDERAGYGEVLVERLSRDLTQRFGRGFGKANLWSMRAFYLAWPPRSLSDLSLNCLIFIELIFPTIFKKHLESVCY